MRQRIVKHQKLSDSRSRLDYWGYISKNVRSEAAQANPDSLACEDKAISDELDVALRALNAKAELLLTKKQRRAFQLVVREGITERDAAKKMACTYQAVQSLVKGAAVKIRKFILLKYGFKYK
jgi:DNA-directed RNA polymerase specialized sigma24 family protein